MPLFIDAHVHIHPQFALERFFAAAFDNFLAAPSPAEHGDSAHQYVLALTEGGDSDVFASLYEQARDVTDPASPEVATDALLFQKTTESNSLLVKKAGLTIILLAGRQLVSQENIEVLSLCCPVKHPDKEVPLALLAQKVAQCGGIPIIPWGVGKWFGSRGRVVADLISSQPEFPLLFADNGNRPLLWPTPSLLQKASEAGFALLSGSDPLPLASHTVRPASFGTCIEGVTISLESPASSLMESLQAQGAVRSYDNFGARTSPMAFIMDQLRINLRNRLPSSTSS